MITKPLVLSGITKKLLQSPSAVLVQRQRGEAPRAVVDAALFVDVADTPKEIKDGRDLFPRYALIEKKDLFIVAFFAFVLFVCSL